MPSAQAAALGAFFSRDAPSTAADVAAFAAATAPELARAIAAALAAAGLDPLDADAPWMARGASSAALVAVAAALARTLSRDVPALACFDAPTPRALEASLAGRTAAPPADGEPE